jgi:hypothetical protein
VILRLALIAKFAHDFPRDDHRVIATAKRYHWLNGAQGNASEQPAQERYSRSDTASNRPDLPQACPLTLAGVAGWPSTQQSKGRA